MRDMIRVFAALLVVVAILGTVFVGPVAAQSPRENLPIPRFVSLRSE